MNIYAADVLKNLVKEYKVPRMKAFKLIDQYQGTLCHCEYVEEAPAEAAKTIMFCEELASRREGEAQ